MHDDMQYDPIQGQGHEPFKVRIRPFSTAIRRLQWELASAHGFLNQGTVSKFYRAGFFDIWPSLCQVTLKLTERSRRVDRQSRTGQICRILSLLDSEVSPVQKCRLRRIPLDVLPPPLCNHSDDKGVTASSRVQRIGYYHFRLAGLDWRRLQMKLINASVGGHF